MSYTHQPVNIVKDYLCKVCRTYGKCTFDRSRKSFYCRKCKVWRKYKDDAKGYNK